MAGDDFVRVRSAAPSSLGWPNEPLSDHCSGGDLCVCPSSHDVSIAWPHPEPGGPFRLSAALPTMMNEGGLNAAEVGCIYLVGYNGGILMLSGLTDARRIYLRASLISVGGSNDY
jgi:hypothetical protein